METLRSVWMKYTLLSVLLGAYLCTPMSTGHASSMDVENLNSTEDDNSTSCMQVDDCDFYVWFIDNGNYGIPGFEKDVVEGILKTKSCEENENGEVLKGILLQFAYCCNCSICRKH